MRNIVILTKPKANKNHDRYRRVRHKKKDRDNGADFLHSRECPLAVQSPGLEGALDAVGEVQEERRHAGYIQRGDAEVAERLNDHQEYIRPAEAVGMLHGRRRGIDHLDREVEQVVYKEGGNGGPGPDHVPSRESGCEVLLYHRGLGFGPAVLKGDYDSEVNMDDDCGEHDNPDSPEERRECAERGRVRIQPAEVDGRVPQHVEDDEDDHQPAGEGHEELAGDGVCGQSQHMQ